MKSDAVMQACYQKATKKRSLELRVSSIILNVYQNAWIEKYDDSRQTFENNAKKDKIRELSNKKLDSSHDVHRAMIEAEDYSKPSWRGKYQSLAS